MVDLNSDGTVIGFKSAGFTDANDINTTNILVGNGDSTSTNSMENLPTTGWGFLITFIYGTNGMQVFLSYSTNDVYVRRKSSGTFYDWKKVTLTTVA